MQLRYLGPGQNAGDTFVLFPHDRVIHTPGAFARRSWANPVFAPSVEGWIDVLHKIAAMDIDIVLPAHGDVANRVDIEEFAQFLTDVYGAVKTAVAKGMTADEMVRVLQFEKYKDWRNYGRRAHSIRSLYTLITTGKPVYLQ